MHHGFSRSGNGDRTQTDMANRVGHAEQAAWPGPLPEIFVQGPMIEGFRNSDLWLCWSTNSHRETFEAGRRVGSLHPQGALLEPGLRPSDSRILPTWEGSLRNQQHPPATSHESRG